MKHRHLPPWPFRTAAWILLPALLAYGVPVNAAAQGGRPQPPARPKVKVNRAVPKVTPPPALPVFSDPATDAEIFRARVFEEPLVPAGATRTGENRALARALLAYVHGGGGEHVEPLARFLAAHPRSPWRMGLLTNLGLVHRSSGRYSAALAAWEEAWRLGKRETELRARAMADRALGELAELYARLGRFDQLEPLFAEIAGRDVRGSSAERISGARRGLWMMQNRPQEAFMCGPMAVARLHALLRPGAASGDIAGARSTLRGTSLAQMHALAKSAGLGLQPAFRRPGAALLVPAMVHWKAGHFAALVREKHGSYLLEDPTFGDSLWVSREALDDEASGYSLVEQGPLPEGWRAVDAGEAAGIWGKGWAYGADNTQIKACSPTAHGKCGAGGTPMAEYDIHLMLVNLTIRDTPVRYIPPRGPAAAFTVRYNHRDLYQPQIFSYSNLGSRWTFDWLSYVVDRGPASGLSLHHLYMRGGGIETYGAGRDPQSGAVTLKVAASPVRYERRLPDGSLEVFTLPDGATGFPRRVFMTEAIDPQGAKLAFTYDAQLRMVAVTDALGQVTTLSYGHPDDPLRITTVTDPFGRQARFDYADGRLVRITDMIGMQSEFEYGEGDFITAMTTPYGTTRFAQAEHGWTRRLIATDPLGAREMVEHGDPTSVLPFSEAVAPQGMWTDNTNLGTTNSFYWDKRAMALFPGDYNKAEIRHFWVEVDPTSTAVLRTGRATSQKSPLERRVFYEYPDLARTGAAWWGPSAVGRVLDDGTSQITRMTYNSKGAPLSVTDAMGRRTVLEYAANDMDLLRVKQQKGAAYDVLGSASYDGRHLPLTITDASGRTTALTYNPHGQPLTVTNAKGETTSLAYDADGYLLRIEGPVAGAAIDLAWDGFGRVYSATHDGRTTYFEYDAMDRVTKVTHPDATFEEIAYKDLDVQEHRDRAGRRSRFVYDALRRLTAVRDPLGRTVQQQWCDCGDLEKLIDASGNETRWERDDQGRVVRQVRADGSSTSLTYEPSTSRVRKVTDAKAQEFHYEYFLDDALRRFFVTSAANPPAPVSYAYDAAYPRLVAKTDGIGTTTYAYHPIAAPPALGAGQLASVDGPLDNDTITYTYDELGRVVNQALNGVAEAVSFDALGRVQTIANPLGTFAYEYQGVSERVARVAYPNGQTTALSYFDAAGDARLKEILHRKPGGNLLSRHAYTYNPEGNIATWAQETDVDPAKTYAFAYDTADQLVGADLTTAGSAAVKRYSYGYDAAGNRIREQIDGVVTTAVANGMNQLTAVGPGGALRMAGRTDELSTVTVQGRPAQTTADGRFAAEAQVGPGTTPVEVKATDGAGNVRTYTYDISVSGSPRTLTYDANGNLLSDGVRTYEWDALNRLVRVLGHSGEEARFKYDSRGRRVEKMAGGVTRTYVYADHHVAEERLSTGGSIRYSRGKGIDRWLAKEEQGTTTYYITDHLGSVVAETSVDGEVRNRRTYDVWGNLDATSAEVAGPAFTGREWDAEVGLYYYRARYYEPRTGRFASQDPILWRGGMNLYAYVRNRPASSRDPSGLSDWLRAPDFFSLDCQILGGLSLSLGRHDTGCVGAGGGLPLLPDIPSCSISIGYMLQGDLPTRDQMRNFMTQHSWTVSGYSFGGGGVTYVHGAGVAFQAGFGFGGWGAGYRYSECPDQGASPAALDQMLNVFKAIDDLMLTDSGGSGDQATDRFTRDVKVLNDWYNAMSNK